MKGMFSGKTWLAATVVALLAAPLRAETELSFYAGWQEVAPGRLNSAVLGDMDIDWEGRPLEMPVYYGAKATWWRPNGTGLGVEFIHAKAYAPNPPALGFDRLELTHGLNIFAANLWYRPAPVGQVQPYGGIGLGISLPHVDIRPIGQAHTHGYQLAGPAVTWTLGAALPLNDRWSVFGEYKGTYTSNHLRLDSGGTINTDIRTNAINLGLSVRF